MSDDLRLQWQVFGGISAFLVVVTGVYWFTSYEDAGSVMLLLAAALAGLTATYLRVQERKLATSEPAAEHGEYQPHASVWPLGIGVAGFLMANGLILGVLFLVPGLLVLAASVVGFAAQTRRRD
ncbi:MAG: aa3-type cytochrome oxidase subunit IV [Acidimicrobiales bacterium]